MSRFSRCALDPRLIIPGRRAQGAIEAHVKEKRPNRLRNVSIGCFNTGDNKLLSLHIGILD